MQFTVMEGSNPCDSCNELIKWLQDEASSNPKIFSLPLLLRMPASWRLDERATQAFKALAEYFLSLETPVFLTIEGFKNEFKPQLDFYNIFFLDMAHHLQRQYGEGDGAENSAQGAYRTINGEIRYAKAQLLKNGSLRAAVQYDHQHVQQQEIQSETHQQSQQQQHIQQTHQRQQQIQRRLERIEDYQKPNTPLQPERLLTFKRLQDYYKYQNSITRFLNGSYTSSAFSNANDTRLFEQWRGELEKLSQFKDVLPESSEKAESVWSSLVGEDKQTQAIADIRNKITHVSAEAFKQVLSYPDEFIDGVVFENLPNGFARYYDEQNQQSILHYDEALKTAPQASDSRINPLTIQLRDKPVRTTCAGSYGQFFPFTKHDEDLIKAYQEFKQATLEKAFECVFNERSGLKDKIAAFTQLIEGLIESQTMHATSIELVLIKEYLPTLTFDKFQAFRWILLKKGMGDLAQWVTLTKELQDSSAYDAFEHAFLASCNDYSPFLDAQSQAIIRALCDLEPAVRSWWEQLTVYHAQAIEHVDLIRLWKGFEYFLESVKKLDIQLPWCPITDSKHMLVTLDRVLFILNHALDPQEQVQHLNLDFSPYGAVRAARTDGYYLVTADMKLGGVSPANEAIHSFYQNEFQHYSKKRTLSKLLSEAIRGTAEGNERESVLRFFQNKHRAEFQSGRFGSFDEVLKYAIVSKLGTKTAAFTSLAGLPVQAALSQVETIDDFDGMQHHAKNARALFENKKYLITLAHFEDSALTVGEITLHPNENNYIKSTVKTIKGSPKKNVTLNQSIKTEGHYKTSLDDLMSADFSRLEKSFFRYLGQQPAASSYERNKTAFHKLQSFCAVNHGFYPHILIVAPLITHERSANIHLLDAFTSFLNYCRNAENSNSIKNQLTILRAQLPNMPSRFRPSILDAEKIMRWITCEQLETVLEQATKKTRWLLFLYDFLQDVHQQKEAYASLDKGALLLSAFDVFQKHDFEESHIHAYRRLLPLCDNDVSAHLVELKQLDQAVLNALNAFLKQAAFSRLQPLESDAMLQLLSSLQNLTAGPTLELEIESCLKRYMPGIQFQGIDPWTHFEMQMEWLEPFKETVQKVKNAFDVGFQRLQNGTGASLLGQRFNLDSALDGLSSQIPIPKVINFVGKRALKRKINRTKEQVNNTITNNFGAFHQVISEKLDQLLEALNEKNMKKLLQQVDSLLPLIDQPVESIEKQTGRTLPFRTITKPALEALCAGMFSNLRDKLAAIIEPAMDGMILQPLKNWHAENPAVRPMLGSFKNDLRQFFHLKIKALKTPSMSQTIQAQLGEIEKAHELILAFKNMAGDALPNLITCLNDENHFKAINSDSCLPESLVGLLQEMNALNPVYQSIGIECLLPALRQDNGQSRLLALQKVKAIATNERPADVFNALLMMALHADRKGQDHLAKLLRLFKLSSVNDEICEVIIQQPVSNAVLNHLINWFANEPLTHEFYTKIFTHYLRQSMTDEAFTSFMNALHASTSESLAQYNDIFLALSNTLSIEECTDLFNKLNRLPPHCHLQVGDLCKKRPFPEKDKLLQSLTSEHRALDFCRSFNASYFGRTNKINYDFDSDTLDGVIQQIYAIHHHDKQALSQDDCQKLKQQYTYIMQISHHHSLPVYNHEGRLAWKPIRSFSCQNAMDYAQWLQVEFSKTFEQNDAAKLEALQLEALALGCAVLNETLGKYPSPNQIFSVLLSFNKPGFMVQKIAPGQGKTYAIALNAFVSFLSGYCVDIATHDKTLSQRDFEALNPFFDYVNIPTGLIEAHIQRNVYCLANRQVTFGTPQDFVHYWSAQKVLRPKTFNLPPQSSRKLICDEVDSLLLDACKDEINFSHSVSDPFNNPHSEFYPYVNEFIRSDSFIKTGKPIEQQPSRKQDVVNLRRYFAQKSQSYRFLAKQLTDDLLDKWITSACVASQLKKDVDFIIGQKSRHENGMEKTHSTAKILANGSVAEGASWSHGVHQFVHARLNEEFKSLILQERMPAFHCDSECEVLDSRGMEDFINFYGHCSALTATPGSEEERAELEKQYGFSFYQLPRRCETNVLTKLAPKLTNEKYHLTQIANVIEEREKTRSLQWLMHYLTKHSDSGSKKHRTHRPVLIFVKDISDADAMYEGLVKHLASAPDAFKVNLHHPTRTVSWRKNQGEMDIRQDQNESLVKKAIIEQAPQQNTITITTGDQLGVGTDINASNLMVIVAGLFRKRKVKQYQHRTARGDKDGTTIMVLNTEKMRAHYSHNHMRSASMKAVKAMQERMDHEEQAQRYWHTKKRKVISDYSNAFDELLKTAANESEIKQHKADFIEKAQECWQELLQASNPGAYYLNPYVRYKNERLLLQPAELLNAFEEYQTKVHELFEQACAALPDLNGLQDKEHGHPPEPLLFSHMPPLTVLHTIEIYNHYRSQLNRDEQAGSAYIRIRQMFVQLQKAAQDNDNSYLLEAHFNRLWMPESTQNDKPFLQMLLSMMHEMTSIDYSASDWFLFLNEAFKQQSLEFPIVFDDLRSEVLTPCVLQYFPEKNPVQRLMKQQLERLLLKTTDPRTFAECFNDCVAAAGEEMPNEQADFHCIKLLSQLIDSMAYRLQEYDSSRDNTTYVEQEIHKKWRHELRSEGLGNLPFKQLTNAVINDFLTAIEAKNELHGRFDSLNRLLLNTIKSVELNHANEDEYNESQFAKLRCLDRCRETLKQFQHLIANGSEVDLPLIAISLGDLLQDESAQWNDFQALVLTMLKFKSLNPNLDVGQVFKLLSRMTCKEGFERLSGILNDYKDPQLALIKDWLITEGVMALLGNEGQKKYRVVLDITKKADYQENYAEFFPVMTPLLSFHALNTLRQRIENKPYTADLLRRICGTYMNPLNPPNNEEKLLKQLHYTKLLTAVSQQTISRENTSAIKRLINDSDFIPADENVACFILEKVYCSLERAINELIKNASGQDKSQLLRFHQWIQELKGVSPKSLTGLNASMIQVMPSLLKNIHSKNIQQALLQLDDHVRATYLSAQHPPFSTELRDNEFRYMIWQLRGLLEQTQARVAKRSSTLHGFARKKLKALQAVEKLYTADAVNSFLKTSNPTSSTYDLLNEFLAVQKIELSLSQKSMTLVQALSLNTRWGFIGHTTAFSKVTKLLKDFKQQFDGSPAKGDQALYRLGLEEAATRLQLKATHANGFFKNKTAYRAKNTAFKESLQNTKQVWAKLQGGDLSLEAKRFKFHVEYDPKVNQNTAKLSRFFNRQGNTTMQRVDELTKRLSK